MLSQLLSPGFNDEGEGALIGQRREREEKGSQRSGKLRKARTQHGVRKLVLALSNGAFPEGAAQGASSVLVSFGIPIVSGVFAHTCSLSAQKAKVRGFQIRSQFGVSSKTLSKRM